MRRFLLILIHTVLLTILLTILIDAGNSRRRKFALGEGADVEKQDAIHFTRPCRV